MADLSDLFDSIPIDDIAKKFGVSEADAAAAVASAVPTIIAGMEANAKDGGASSLEQALGQHEGKAGKGKLSLDDIDVADGEKIVRNVLGTNQDAVAEKVAEANPSSFVSKDLILKVLPVVAPLVISWIASKFFGGKTAEAEPAKAADDGDSGGGIGDIVGSVLGGLSGGATSGGGIGDLLGGILGGLTGGGAASSSSSSSSGGGLGDLLGGLGGLGGLLGGGSGGSSSGSSGGGFDIGSILGGLGGLLGGGKK